MSTRSATASKAAWREVAGLRHLDRAALPLIDDDDLGEMVMLGVDCAGLIGRAEDPELLSRHALDLRLQEKRLLDGLFLCTHRSAANEREHCAQGKGRASGIAILLHRVPSVDVAKTPGAVQALANTERMNFHLSIPGGDRD